MLVIFIYLFINFIIIFMLNLTFYLLYQKHFIDYLIGFSLVSIKHYLHFLNSYLTNFFKIQIEVIHEHLLMNYD
jgi:multisubunit Na+/H+ antiporter MnhC subunit